MRRLAAAAALLLPLWALGADVPSPPVSRLGGFTPVWQAPADGPGYGEDGDLPHLLHGASGDLLISSGEASGEVVLREAATGRVHTRLRMGRGQRLEQAGLAGDTVVAHRSEPGGAPSDVPVHRLSGHRAGSGGQLWSVDASAVLERETGARPEAVQTTVTAAGIVLGGTESGALVGLRPGDGSTAWRAAVPGAALGGCERTMAAGPTALAVMLHCHGVTTVTALDPATGHPRWRRDVPGPGEDAPGEEPLDQGGWPRSLEVGADGTVLASAGEVHEVYSPTGKRLVAAGRGQAYGLAVTERGFVFQSQPDAWFPAEITTAVGRDGRIAWRRGLPAGRIHAVGRVRGPRLAVAGAPTGPPDGSMPAFLTVVDLDDGAFTQRPLPTYGLTSTLIGTGAGLALVHDGSPGGGRVTAYRLSPPSGIGAPELGGVAPEAWPDACGLLRVTDLAVLRTGYSAHPRHRRIAGLPLPHPATCDFAPPLDGGAAVSLAVEWVAPSPAAARSLVAGELAYRAHGVEDRRTSERRGEGVWQIDGTGLAPRPDSALITAGGVVVRLRVFDDPEGVRRVAETVARRLRETRG
ncbi:hypothetical protein GCM10010517_34890 [Streptosporangium fragile]|uniref:Pyrrolo-quinoline quinone repeat domain-containing protein n=1 Tax=Streptosporangium fragile TaxID=46186 RepID=A0ABN3VZL2_9ACTN